MREEKKAAPAAVAGQKEAVAYLDIGEGGYLELGSDLSDEALRKLPKGRHMLAIVGTYGVDGYVPVAAPTTQAAPQPADPQELLPEIQRLQRALAFWLPMGPSEDHPLQERIAHDAFLLAGYYGPDEPSAYELGHVALAGTAAPVAQGDALTYEQSYAIRQGHEIASSDAYFEARPQIDNNDRRGVFRAGFDRGWDAARTQAKEGGEA